MVATALEALASLAIQPNQAVRAVYLLAAAAALRAQMSIPVQPLDRSALEGALAAARSHLGEDGFAAAWASVEGQPIELLLSSALSYGGRAGRGS